MFLSILIVSNSNRFKQLDLLINSIKLQNYQKKNYEILLANQSSQHYINKDFKINEFFILNSNSLSYSRNFMIDHALGEYCIFLDDDCVLDKYYLYELTEVIKKNKYPDFISGNIFNLEDGKFYNKNFKKKNFKHNLYSYECCLSSNMTIKKNILLKMGNFDENFSIGSIYNSNEESDLLIRFINSGYDCIHNRAHKVYHPCYDEKKYSLKEIKNRSYLYGIGKGALIKKHKNIGNVWYYTQSIICLLKPLILLLFNFILLNKSSMYRYYFTAKGRLKGLISNDPN